MTLAWHPFSRSARLAALLCAALAGCSAQQAYSTGQAWQRNECQKLPDAGARTRCLEAAALSPEAYRRETEAAKLAR